MIRAHTQLGVPEATDALVQHVPDPVMLREAWAPPSFPLVQVAEEPVQHVHGALPVLVHHVGGICGIAFGGFANNTRIRTLLAHCCHHKHGARRRA